MKPTKKTLAFLLSALLVTTMATSTNATELKTPAPNKTIKLIKGDLSNWIVDGNKTIEVDGKEVPVWSVKDGVIRCSGVGKSRGFLRYNKKVDDFDLHIEYRYTPGCNSGIGLRTVPYFKGKRKTRPSKAGYEVQILDEKRVDTSEYEKPGLSTSLYGYIERSKYVQKPDGKWNVIDIRCQGPHIRIVLNGEVLHDIDQREFKELKNKPMSGYICLQDHGHVIDFRNVRLKRLVKAKLSIAETK